MRRATFPGLPLLMLAAAAEAQTPYSAVPRATAQTTLVYPLTVVTKNNMDFGDISEFDCRIVAISDDGLFEFVNRIKSAQISDQIFL